MNDPEKLPDIWHALDLRYAAALIGVSLWIGMRDSEKEPVRRRVVKTTASALLGFGASKDLSPYLGGSEIAAAVLLMAFGIIILDTITGLLNNKSLVTSIARRWLGGKDDNQ